MSSLQRLRAGLARWRSAGPASPKGPAAIGLDLGAERLNLVQFGKDSSGPVLRAAASLPLPQAREALLSDPTALKALLRTAQAGRAFSGRRVVACLPAAELRVFPVSYTAVPGRDDDSVLATDLRARLGAELDHSVLDYLPIRTDNAEPNQRDALVALASRERVLAYVTALERAGLEVSAIDIGPAALARLIVGVNSADVRAAHPDALLINFGSSASHVSVVSGRRLLLDRPIEFAEQSLLARLTRALGVDEGMARRLLLDKGLHADPAQGGDDAEIARTLVEVLRPEFAALVAEVHKTLIYTASRNRGRGVDQIYLLGSVGRYPGADRLMQGLLSIPVEVLNPFRVFRSPLPAAELARLEPMAGIALACGLALRGWGGDA